MRSLRFACALACALSLAAPATAAADASGTTITSTTTTTTPVAKLIYPVGGSSLHRSATTTAGAHHMNYYGGHVIQHVKVIGVIWGAGTYLPEETRSTAPNVGSFYAQATNSKYFDWLSEYNTNINAYGGGAGTNESIGRGSFAGLYTITPSAANNGSTIDDAANIEPELAAQITAGNLPAPDADTMYALIFRQGQTVTLDGSASGVAFCAYHGTLVRNGQHIPYSVLPNVAAVSGCGSDANSFNNFTMIASHELFEAVTDPDAALATQYAPPLSWYDPAGIFYGGEIGDLCLQQVGSITGTDGFTYAVQQQWSNRYGDCIVTPPDDFSLTGPSNGVSLASPGTSASATITTALLSGNPQSITVSASNLPAGVTASFAPATVASGDASTMTVSASSGATAGSYTFTVTGTGMRTHNISVALVIGAPGSQFSVSVNPTSVSLSAGFTTKATVTSTVTQGYAQSLQLSYSTLANLDVRLEGKSYSTGDTATLDITAPTTLTPGTYGVDLDFIGVSYTKVVSMTVTVTAPSDFSVAVTPNHGTTAIRGSVTATVTPTLTKGAGGPLTLATLFPPNGVIISFSPPTVLPGQSSTMTIQTYDNVYIGDQTINVGAKGGGQEHYASYTLTVNPVDDLSIAVAPTQALVVTGSSTTVAVTTTLLSGTPQNVSFGASTVSSSSALQFSFSPWNTTTGGGSTLTIDTGSTPAGTYDITVSANTREVTRAAHFLLTIAGSGSITNGGFEDLVFNGWTPSGYATETTGARTGNWAGWINSASAPASVSQSFVVDASAPVLSLWYKPTCYPAQPATSVSVTLLDRTAQTTTALPATCTHTQTWARLSATLTGGHLYTLTIAGTGSSAVAIDDVKLTPTAVPLSNGGFESGGLASWDRLYTFGGVSSTSAISHSGTTAAQLGPQVGDNSIAQTFTVDASAPALSFWYNATCAQPQYESVSATYVDHTEGTSGAILAPTCPVAGWHQASAVLTPGHWYTLTLTFRGYVNTLSSALFDDVTMSPLAAGPFVNGDFEGGDLHGWLGGGSAQVYTLYGRGGGHAAALGVDSSYVGNSTLDQTFVADSVNTQLSAWVSTLCADTSGTEGTDVVITDDTTNTATSLLSHSCPATMDYQQVTAKLVGGHVYTLTVTNEINAVGGPSTVTFVDDVTFATPPQPVVNGGFESGLTGWTANGTVSAVTSGVHAGTSAAKLMATKNHASTLAQTFTVTSSGTLSMWYSLSCLEPRQSSGSIVLVDRTAGTTAYVLAPACTNTNGWRQLSAAVVAGHTYTLTFGVRAGAKARKTISALFDDVSVS